MSDRRFGPISSGIGEEKRVNALERIQSAVDASLRALAPPASLAQPGARLTWRERLKSPLARILVAAVLGLALLAAFFMLRPPSVETAPITRGEAVDVVYATGVVDYVRQARIAPIVTAPIYRVFVEEGQGVRRGAQLAQLEDGPQRGTVAQLEAQASTARLAATRVQTLYQRGFASRAAWDEARGQRDAALAAAQSARARLADYAITAPFAGTVLRRDAEPGDLASPSRVLFVVADESSLRVTAELDERDIARVERGQSALIRADAFPNQTFNAEVTEVTPQGDAATRVFRVRLGLDPQSPLRAGMTVEANIISGRRDNALLAPTAAVREDVVWVVANGRVERRAIVRGAVGGERTEIVQGVNDGEQVVLNPSDSLRNGRRVRVRS
jgi:RND family efflux transporter MFP subunit